MMTKPRLPQRSRKGGCKGAIVRVLVVVVLGTITFLWSSQSQTEATLSISNLQATTTTESPPVGKEVVDLPIPDIDKEEEEDTEARTLEKEDKSFDETPLKDGDSDTGLGNNQLERRTIAGVDVLLQKPSTTPPRGIFFGAHGCNHAHTDWWPSTPDICPECIGLPEEQAIVNMALSSPEFQFLVVAISSVNRERKCWTAEDGPRVAAVLKELLEEYGTTSDMDMPVIAFGASSGGAFVGTHLVESMRDANVPLTGFISQIAAREPPTTGADLSTFPTAVYITMDRDLSTDAAAQGIVNDLQQLGMNNLHQLAVKQIKLAPLPITREYFSQRIEGITSEQSRQMMALLGMEHYLDSLNHLRQDPRRSNWRKVLRSVVPETVDSLEADGSAVSEVMNVAWAKHELARDGVHEAIEFILSEKKSGGDGSLNVHG